MKTVWSRLIPTERGWVTMGVFALLAIMLFMARENPSLWDVKLFEVLIQAVTITGLLNMILAFHFSANKSDEAKTENTRHALDTIKAVASHTGDREPFDTLATKGDDQ